METRANYFLIGLFTLASILAALGFFLWFARIEVTRQFDYYDVILDSAAGLGRAGDVRFNGILVGRVLDISFMRDDPGLVRVRIEVDGNTPVKTDTVARLESQGVTGVSYIGLTGGSADAAPLVSDEPGRVPVIVAERSSVQAILEDAPDLLAEAIVLLRELRGFASEDNRVRVANILENADRASGGLGAALEDFSRISETVRAATDQIGAFTARLDPVAANVNKVLESADTTLADVSAAMQAAQGTLDAAQATFVTANGLIAGRGPALIDGYEAVAVTARETLADLGDRTGALIGQAGDAVEVATARLRELESVLREAETTLTGTTTAMAAVETASDNFDALLNTEGAALVQDARTAMTALTRIADEDMPAIVADVRAASATVNRVVATVGEDVTGFTGQLDGLGADTSKLIAEATETFRSANATLGALGPAIETTERALAAAEGAFAGADRVINEDIDGIVADIRRVATELDAALSQVAADLPGLGTELRATLAAMTRAAERFETMVARSAPGVEDFATTALPQWSRLAVEARSLAVSLERLVQRIERDPARFLLGGQAPEYRR